MPKGLWALMGVVDTSTYRGYNFFIRYFFGVIDTPLERYIQGVHILFGLTSIFGYMLITLEPKKRHLGPQNGPINLGPEKL